MYIRFNKLFIYSNYYILKLIFIFVSIKHKLVIQSSYKIKLVYSLSASFIFSLTFFFLLFSTGLFTIHIQKELAPMYKLIKNYWYKGVLSGFLF